MEKKNSNKSKYLLYLVLLISLALAFSITVYVINSINLQIYEKQNNKLNPPSEPLLPELTVPENIVLDKLDLNIKFDYIVTNIGEYNLNITIENPNIATLNNSNLIIPLQPGNTKIITEIDCIPSIRKTTNLTILDTVTDISYKIKALDGIEQDTLCVGNTYILEIYENAIINHSPALGFDDKYVSNISKIDYTNGMIKYKFDVINYGDFSFNYVSKYVDKTIDLCAYVYPSNFEVDFSNITFENNIGNLYLFNTDYINLANADNIFNISAYEILTTDNSNDNITVTLSGDCVSISNKTITALTEGQAYITFKSNISNTTKTYTINVVKILPTSYKFNNSEFSVGENLKLEYNLNELYDFNITYYPFYALANLTYDYADNIIIENNQIKILENKPSNIYVKVNNSTILTLNISITPNLAIDCKIDQSTTAATLNESTLTIDFSNNCYISLSCAIYNTDTNTKHTIQNMFVEIENLSIISSSSATLEVKNEILSLKVNSTGITKITLTNYELNISIILTVIVK